MKNKLKLYLWEDVLCDYTSGVCFALAYSVEEARELVIQSMKEYYLTQLELDAVENEPIIIDSPFGFHLWGGG